MDSMSSWDLISAEFRGHLAKSGISKDQFELLDPVTKAKLFENFRNQPGAVSFATEYKAPVIDTAAIRQANVGGFAQNYPSSKSQSHASVALPTSKTVSHVISPTTLTTQKSVYNPTNLSGTTNTLRSALTTTSPVTVKSVSRPYTTSITKSPTTVNYDTSTRAYSTYTPRSSPIIVDRGTSQLTSSLGYKTLTYSKPATQTLGSMTLKSPTYIQLQKTPVYTYPMPLTYAPSLLQQPITQQVLSPPKFQPMAYQGGDSVIPVCHVPPVVIRSEVPVQQIPRQEPPPPAPISFAQPAPPPEPPTPPFPMNPPPAPMYPPYSGPLSQADQMMQQRFHQELPVCGCGYPFVLAMAESVGGCGCDSCGQEKHGPQLVLLCSCGDNNFHPGGWAYCRECYLAGKSVVQCVCKRPMTRLSADAAAKTYNPSSTDVRCNMCRRYFVAGGVWHCKAMYVNVHPAGYDVCDDCAHKSPSYLDNTSRSYGMEEPTEPLPRPPTKQAPAATAPKKENNKSHMSGEKSKAQKKSACAC